MSTVMLRDESGRPIKEIDPLQIADGHVLICVVHEGKERTILLSDFVQCVAEAVLDTPWDKL